MLLTTTNNNLFDTFSVIHGSMILGLMTGTYRRHRRNYTDITERE